MRFLCVVGTRPEAILANAMSEALNGAWAQAGRPFQPPYFSIQPCDAVGVWIHGDGKGELLNIQLTSPREYMHAYGEHYVTIDFTRVVAPEGSTVTASPFFRMPEATVPAYPRKFRFGRITYCTGNRRSVRLRSLAMWTVSKWSNSAGPWYQGIASLLDATLTSRRRGSRTSEPDRWNGLTMADAGLSAPLTSA